MLIYVASRQIDHNEYYSIRNNWFNGKNISISFQNYVGSKFSGSDITKIKIFQLGCTYSCMSLDLLYISNKEITIHL